MSARAPRFEVVRSDAGWFARFRAANGQIQWQTEVYSKSMSARAAIQNVARAMSPTARIWFSTTRIANQAAGSELAFGHPDDSYLSAHRVEVRTVDERSAR